MSAPSPSPRTSLARLHDRYELLDEMPHVTGGRLFRARDLAFAELVSVKQLGPGCGLGPDERKHLENMVRHLQCLPHPNLVRIQSFDSTSGLLVQEWVQGVSVLDLLRRRRELTTGETLRLLAALPATLDFLAREAVSPPRPLLGKLFVRFEGNASPDSVAATPVDQWPPFTLKLNPLSLRSLIASPSTDDTTNTVIADPRQPAEIKDSYGPREFARLLYEMLGGRIRELDTRRYSPIGALHEAGNAVLRRSLLAMPHPDCQALWKDLVEALPVTRISPTPATAVEPTPVLRTLRIPAPLLAGAHPGTVLKLEPHNPAGIPIHLSIRPRFAIGRSSQQADFLAKVLPENETNNALTNRLSRVHATLELLDGQPAARDGAGRGPSLNGSFLDGQPLQPEPPTPIPARALLWLGEEYSLELIPLISPVPPAWKIDNLEAWRGPAGQTAPALHGALVCLPANDQSAVRHSAWLFTQVGFGLDAAERLVWDTRAQQEAPASFHHHRGCFWISNRSLPETTLALNDIPLPRETIAPLVPGQTLRLGSQLYTVHLE